VFFVEFAFGAPMDAAAPIAAGLQRQQCETLLAALAELIRWKLILGRAEAAPKPSRISRRNLRRDYHGIVCRSTTSPLAGSRPAALRAGGHEPALAQSTLFKALMGSCAHPSNRPKHQPSSMAGRWRQARRSLGRRLRAPDWRAW